MEHLHEILKYNVSILRSSHPELFLFKGILKICCKFTGEHPCRSLILIKLLCNFIEITLRHGCSPVKLLLIFWTAFLKKISEWLLPNTPILEIIILKTKRRSTFLKERQSRTNLPFSLWLTSYVLLDFTDKIP